MSYPRHRLSRQNALVVYTEGDINVTSSTLTLVDPALDLWIPARPDDVVEFGINLRSPESEGILELGVAIVDDAGDLIRYSGSTGGGVSGWGSDRRVLARISGVTRTIVENKDVVDGGLFVRLYAHTTMNEVRVLNASTMYPLTFWTDNIGKSVDPNE